MRRIVNFSNNGREMVLIILSGELDSCNSK